MSYLYTTVGRCPALTRGWWCVGWFPHPCPWSRGSPSSPVLHGQSSLQTPRCNRAMFLTSLTIDKQPEETNDTISFLLLKRLPPYLIHCVSCLGSRTCWWVFLIQQGGQNFTNCQIRVFTSLKKKWLILSMKTNSGVYRYKEIRR